MIQWNEHGLAPVVAQCVRTGRTLMLAWMNAEALELTRSTGVVHYFSRSRNALWKKGETSGHVQRLIELRTDCDRDAILAIVDQTGPACHTLAPSCFYVDLLGADDTPRPAPAGSMLDRLEMALEARKNAPEARSYTRKLLDGGPTAVNAKITEEAGELAGAIAGETDDRVVSEAADLVYHTLVGLVLRGVKVEGVLGELQRRFGVSGLAEKASRR
jgi:phosphoribosyl-ATP pyrophosphohydrolase/phosphoribosyl-AMP cyclohydrolase